MAPKTENTQPTEISQVEFQDLLREKMRQAVRWALVEILEQEVDEFIGAQRYERNSTRRDQRNGHYRRTLGTATGVIEGLSVPRTRKGFRTQVFERYQRRRAELDEAIGDMFVQGISTSRVGEVVETLTGAKPSASTVSRVFHTLDEEFLAWKGRSLESHYLYAFADGTYFTVIYEGEGCKTPILAVVGIDSTGKRELLAFTIGERENQQAWEYLLSDLKRR